MLARVVLCCNLQVANTCCESISGKNPECRPSGLFWRDLNGFVCASSYNRRAEMAPARFSLFRQRVEAARSLHLANKVGSSSSLWLQLLTRSFSELTQISTSARSCNARAVDQWHTNSHTHTSLNARTTAVVQTIVGVMVRHEAYWGLRLVAVVVAGIVMLNVCKAYSKRNWQESCQNVKSASFRKQAASCCCCCCCRCVSSCRCQTSLTCVIRYQIQAANLASDATSKPDVVYLSPFSAAARCCCCYRSCVYIFHHTVFIFVFAFSFRLRCCYFGRSYTKHSNLLLLDETTRKSSSSQSQTQLDTIKVN